MSHAAPSLSGLAPRQSTFGVTTQKFGIAEPRLFEHGPATLCVDTDAQQPHNETTTRRVKVRLHLRAKLNERISSSLLMPNLCVDCVLAVVLLKAIAIFSVLFKIAEFAPGKVGFRRLDEGVYVLDDVQVLPLLVRNHEED